MRGFRKCVACPGQGEPDTDWGCTSMQLRNAYPVEQSRQDSGINVLHGRSFTTKRDDEGLTPVGCTTAQAPGHKVPASDQARLGL